MLGDSGELSRKWGFALDWVLLESQSNSMICLIVLIILYVKWGGDKVELRLKLIKMEQSLILGERTVFDSVPLSLSQSLLIHSYRVHLFLS